MAKKKLTLEEKQEKIKELEKVKSDKKKEQEIDMKLRKLEEDTRSKSIFERVWKGFCRVAENIFK